MTKPLLGTRADALAVRQAIGRAASRTGVDFAYLYNQARSESGLDPDVRATTSSATGLYQFIDQSWLGVLKQHGSEHGYGWAADAIQRQGGRWTVKAEYRDAVFALRRDPEAASLMAAESASDNADGLKAALGREVGSTDLYFAHFLGPAGAARFLKAADARPGASAAALFPREAAVNRSIFYTKSGEARSLSQVYALMGRKIGGDAPALPVPGTDEAVGAVLMADGAALSATPPTAPVAQLAALDDAGDKTPIELLQAVTDPAMRRADLLRPQPAQARLAYLMVLSSLTSV